MCQNPYSSADLHSNSKNSASYNAVVCTMKRFVSSFTPTATGMYPLGAVEGPFKRFTLRTLTNLLILLAFTPIACKKKVCARTSRFFANLKFQSLLSRGPSRINSKHSTPVMNCRDGGR